MPKSEPSPAPAPQFFSPQVSEARRFYLDLTPPARTPLAVVCGGLERSSPDYIIDRSGFPFFSIEFVARGRGTLLLSGEEKSLLPGTVFVYGPNIPHRIATDPDDPLVKYFVDFTGRRAGRLLHDARLPPGTSGCVFSPNEIRRIFDDLIESGLKPTRFANRLCATLLEYLTLKIADSRTTWEAAQTPAFATYERCRQYIQAHYMKLHSLAQIGRQCHVATPYLCRLFQRYDHQTPYHFLMQLKMNLAAERLQHPGMLVKQVAAELGFENPFHFSRAFKQAMGLSPEAFRQLL